MQSETGFPNSHQLKSCVTYKSRLKLAARAVLSVDAGLLVNQCHSFAVKTRCALQWVAGLQFKQYVSNVIMRVVVFVSAKEITLCNCICFCALMLVCLFLCQQD